MLCIDILLGKMKSTNKKIMRAVTLSMSVNFFTPMVKDLQQQGYEIVSVSSLGPGLEQLQLILYIRKKKIVAYLLSVMAEVRAISRNCGHMQFLSIK